MLSYDLANYIVQIHIPRIVHLQDKAAGLFLQAAMCTCCSSTVILLDDGASAGDETVFEP